MIVKKRLAGYLIGILLIGLCAFPNIALSQKSSNLTNSARTSTGVYKADGTLIKSLWIAYPIMPAATQATGIVKMMKAEQSLRATTISN
ncbi:hypothetical protein GXP67_03435 [Rhodocytophaga rosea]|uniref:Uncharacterized protein n=1 Tax=Rhodocytophaga rosea TaxID=2704465 RepID=A0A6C0GCV0_9BACT|nr:hypothetical protein [Rhodocytophaga rosea]QHT65786.1 hypothetical protein GXP67_03435 [Rhodocytophaga rosea]